MSDDQATILVVHGPNLNLLGSREPTFYGSTTLADINADLIALGEASDPPVSVKTFQSNHEGALIDFIQENGPGARGIIANPGGLTHTSVALRDAFSAVGCPLIEVHISNIHAREAFRHSSLIAPVAVGQIAGLGPRGYLLALSWFIASLKRGEHG